MKVHPNIQLLERMAERLGDLLDHFVLVGGSTTVLMITDPAAPPARASIDIDAVVQVENLGEYHRLGKRLRERGFYEDQSDGAPLCRWRTEDLILDVMPTQESILGFTNRWYAHSIASAEHYALPSGRMIRLATPPCFLGTKFEAFHSRGSGDFLASEDMEDIITLLDGRSEIVAEVHAAEPALRTYLVQQMKQLLSNTDFLQALPGHLEASGATAGRSGTVVQRIKKIIEIEP